jgi:hypothetical protein
MVTCRIVPLAASGDRSNPSKADTKGFCFAPSAASGILTPSHFEAQATMSDLSLSIDRFEGREKQLAVLVSDAGEEIVMPRRLLPKECKAGDVLTVAIERDVAATDKVAQRARQIQQKLKRSDPGGDVKL